MSATTSSSRPRSWPPLALPASIEAICSVPCQAFGLAAWHQQADLTTPPPGWESHLSPALFAQIQISKPKQNVLAAASIKYLWADTENSMHAGLIEFTRRSQDGYVRLSAVGVCTPWFHVTIQSTHSRTPRNVANTILAILTHDNSPWFGALVRDMDSRCTIESLRSEYLRMFYVETEPRRYTVLLPDCQYNVPWDVRHDTIAAAAIPTEPKQPLLRAWRNAAGPYIEAPTPYNERGELRKGYVCSFRILRHAVWGGVRIEALPDGKEPEELLSIQHWWLPVRPADRPGGAGPPADAPGPILAAWNMYSMLLTTYANGDAVIRRRIERSPWMWFVNDVGDALDGIRRNHTERWEERVGAAAAGDGPSGPSRAEWRPFRPESVHDDRRRAEALRRAKWEITRRAMEEAFGSMETTVEIPGIDAPSRPPDVSPITAQESEALSAYLNANPDADAVIRPILSTHVPHRRSVGPDGVEDWELSRLERHVYDAIMHQLAGSR